MAIAVLALQGAFIEHEKRLESLGAEVFEIREAADLARPFSGLVLPGGESTVQGKLLLELGLFDALKARIEGGLPVLATCAGTILLASRLEDDPTKWFGTLPVTVHRNAFGRQLGSFRAEEEMKGIGRIPMTFIRAPLITETAPGVDILARSKGGICAVRFGNQLALTFHPELDPDPAVHRLFLEMVRESGGKP